MRNTVLDILGVGVGPFNLSLACLAEPLPIDTIFFDNSLRFEWHPGLLIEESTLQVPFLADLVTFADPTSPFSFLNYLKQTNRIYPFFIRENMFILRAEYSRYCYWVAQQLPNVHFGKSVDRIEYDKNQRLYHVFVRDVNSNIINEYFARNIVLGTGSTPYIPEVGDLRDSSDVIHSSCYLNHKESIQQASSITVVGSGQSAAEIFMELLKGLNDRHFYELNWVTRSPRFFPLEYGKLTLEFTSPDYLNYFHGLPSGTRNQLIKEQSPLYKGINLSLINEIYDLLYTKSVQQSLAVRIIPNVSLEQISRDDNERLNLRFHQKEVDEHVHLTTDKVIMGTGYRYSIPECITPILPFLNFDESGQLDVALDYEISDEGNIFVQNVGLHTHGLVTPDLGMGCYRNSIILKKITGRDCYPIERKIAFQDFFPYLNKEVVSEKS